jgi:hypothetical protein
MTRRATALGLAASLALHMLLALLNPRLPPPRAESAERRPIHYEGVLIDLTEAALPTLTSAPATAPVSAEDGAWPADPSAPLATGSSPSPATHPAPAPAAAAPAAVRDRLAYRATAAWGSHAIALESYEACRERERGERLEREIADPRRGTVRPPTDPPPPNRLQAGIRITVGPERDPPPVAIRAPALPDSMPTVRPYGEGLYRYELPAVTTRRPPGCADPAGQR